MDNSIDPELLKSLTRAECYPGCVGEVEVLQTHLSVICLAGDRAYKLKKPVKFPFADFSTRKLREAICHDEVRLNRRLCPDVYLGVVPLWKSGSHSWSFREKGGEIVDHAVLMRRLPNHRLMNRVLESGDVCRDDIAEIAHIVAKFHAASTGAPEAEEAGSPARQREAILDNFAEIQGSPHFDPDLLFAIEMRARSELDLLVAALDRRADEGRIVDGHGDLHTRNIFLTDPPTIFDCIEFNRDFRCGDVAAENAFLVMDLIYRGRADLAEHYLATYMSITADDGQRELMPALVSFRALVRAKVAALALEDESISPEEREKNRESAVRHLDLAAAAMLAWSPVLLVFCGLPATGKSTLAKKLSDLVGWPHFSSDLVRKRIAGVTDDAALPESCYTHEFSLRTYEQLITDACESAAKACRPSIADANFPSRELRALARSAAESRGLRPVFIWLEAEESVVEQRLTARTSKSAHGSDADLDVYQKLAEEFEELAADEGIESVRIDAGAPTDECFHQLLTELLNVVE